MPRPIVGRGGLHNRGRYAAGLLPLAAVADSPGPTLIRSNLAEDLDYESAVEWFLRRRLPNGQAIGRLVAEHQERLVARSVAAGD